MTDVKPDKHGWMPIETAPRDGTNIIVYAPVDGVTASKFTLGCWQRLTVVYGDFPSNDPTHWQPLPEPPEGQ